MSKVTTTISAEAVESIDKATARDFDRLVRAFTERNDVHVTRTDIVGRLRARGYSVAGIVKAVTVYTHGATPAGFSNGSVGRYATVAAAVTREDVLNRLDGFDKSDRAQIIADMVTLSAKSKGAERVLAAATLIAESKSATDALIAVGALKGEANAVAITDATRKPERPTGGETADGGKNVETETEAPAGKGTTHEAQSALSAASTLALIAELTRRTGQRGFTPDAVVADAFDALASAWEEAVTTTEVLAEA